MKQKKRKTLQINENKEISKTQFIKNYKHWRISEKNKEDFSTEEWKQFSDVVSTSPLDDLFDLVKTVTKEIHKNENLKKSEINKKKQSKKSFWSFGADENPTFSEEDRKQLEDFYEQNFSDELLALPFANIRDKKFVEFQFEIFLNGGSFNLISTKDKGLVEKIVSLEYKGLSCNIKKRENNKEINFQLEEISINAFEKKNGKNIFSQNIFKKNDLIVPKNQEKMSFLLFNYEENPLMDEKDQIADEIIPDYCFDLNLGSTQIIYDSTAIKWVRKFFDIDIEDQEIVDQTLKTINKINEDYKVNTKILFLKQIFFLHKIAIQEKIQTLPILRINVKMESPNIIIPLNSIGRAQNTAFWFINLGKFSFVTNEMLLKKSCKAEEKIFENFILKLEEMRVLFFSSIDSLKPQMNSEEIDEKIALPVVKNIFIDINLKKLNKSFTNLIKDQPEFNIDISLNKFEVCLNDLLLKEILYVQSYFSSIDRKEFQAKIISRNKLNETATKIGKISKKGNFYQDWTEYFAILSNGNIYFFEEMTDLKYHFKLPVFNVVLDQSKEKNSNSFTVTFIKNF